MRREASWRHGSRAKALTHTATLQWVARRCCVPARLRCLVTTNSTTPGVCQADPRPRPPHVLHQLGPGLNPPRRRSASIFATGVDGPPGHLRAIAVRGKQDALNVAPEAGRRGGRQLGRKGPRHSANEEKSGLGTALGFELANASHGYVGLGSEALLREASVEAPLPQKGSQGVRRLGCILASRFELPGHLPTVALFL